MTVRTSKGGRMIQDAATAAGVTVTTLRPIVADDWMVTLSETTTREMMIAWLRALVVADPAVLVMVHKDWMDAAKLAAL